MKIGIDLGGSHIAVGIVTEEGKLLAKQEKNLIFEQNDNENIQEQIRDSMLSLINSVLKEIQIPIFIIEEIGIGIPGIVQNNMIIKCDKYKIQNWNLSKEIEEHYGVPVKIANDALCAAKAEKEYGNLKDSKKAVFLCLGTGIGGATIIENNIYSSEYGHMVIQKEGIKCHCGKKGCYETYSSMKAFKEGLVEYLNLNKEISSEEILNILKEKKNDKELNEYIDKYINTLLIGISNIVNIIAPDKICIGGSFVYFDEILYKRLLEKIQFMISQYERPKIVLAKLENNAGIIGATLI